MKNFTKILLLSASVAGCLAYNWHIDSKNQPKILKYSKPKFANININEQKYHINKDMQSLLSQQFRTEMQKSRFHILDRPSLS